MIEYERIIQILHEMNWEEKQYEALYNENPEIYKEPIKTWEEFRNRNRKSVPKNPFSIVESFLTENEFFPESDFAVNCFKNARFCPAFLHQLEFIKIVYVLEGSVRFYFNQSEYRMEEGQFCIVAPGIEQAVFSCDPDDVVINVLIRASTFTNAFSSLLSEHTILSDYFWKIFYSKYNRQILMFQCKKNNKLDKMILKLFYEVNLEPTKSNLIMKSYVIIFFVEALREHSESIQALMEVENSDYKIPKILQDIRENVNDISLPVLADKWDMSELEMNHYLKIEIGYSFSYLLMDIRMKKAVDWLINTDSSIEKIMEETGFKDSTYFYKNFKNRFGVTPQSYRENNGLKRTIQFLT